MFISNYSFVFTCMFLLLVPLVGYTLCHQQLAMPGVTDIWKVALQDGYCITLFRDEVIMFHKEFQNLLDGMKGYCLISNREGLVTSLYIMGLATIDAHSQKEHTEIHNIPKFGVNQASFD